jgi:hypothetical protein
MKCKPTYGVIPIEVFTDLRLSLRDIRVLGVLYAHDMDRDGECHPSRKIIAEMTGMSICRVSVATTRLCQFGWLRKLGKGGKSKTTRYEFIHVVGKKKVVDSTTLDKTVTDSVTVSDNKTVTESDTKTVTESVTRFSMEKKHGEKTIYPPSFSSPNNSLSNTNENHQSQTQSSGRTPPKRVNGSSVGFERFYAAYPRKVAKREAIKAWDKVAPDDGLVERILDALERQKASWAAEKQERKFIPYPASWLNGQRWEDEVENKPIESKPLPTGRKRGVL